jgi:putative membrane protein insertion efficiency factor
MTVWRCGVWLWDHSLGWVLTVVFVLLIQAYRHTFSLMMPPTCRFHPSCSAYALGAVRTHGGLKGGMLSAWRLVRCNPFNGGGYDPVPDEGRWVPYEYPDGRPRHVMIRSRKASHVRS